MGVYDSIADAYRFVFSSPGQKAMAASIPVAMASDQSAIPTTHPPTTLISPPITTTAVAYSANDNIGGELTLTNAVRIAGGSGRLMSLTVIDTMNQKPSLTVLIYDSDPAATYTDNAAMPSLVTDAPKLIASQAILATDFVTVGTIAIAQLGNLNKAVKSAATQNLWAVVFTTGTPTYGANNTSLVMRFGILQD